MGFLDFGFIDAIDIFVCAFIFYILYTKLKDTTAMTILVGVVFIYVIWLVVKAMNMSLLCTIMNRVADVGIIALVIVFQQEIRKFLLDMGNQTHLAKIFSFDKINKESSPEQLNIEEIVEACTEFAKDSTGALIVLPNHSNLSDIINDKKSEKLNCDISARLLGSLFYKNSPLHDGAVIIEKGKIVAAKCTLPNTTNPDVPKNFGTRHLSAIGISEVSDSLVIVVSEQRGEISFCEYGVICQDVTPSQLRNKLKERFDVWDGDDVANDVGIKGFFRKLKNFFKAFKTFWKNYIS